MSVNYLRISVTDRCNLKCIYCNPLGSTGLIDREDILSFKDIRRITRILAEFGITKVRLTGGEPLIRKNICQLVEKIAKVPGIKEVVLTTNGVLLEPMAEELKAAGLNRVNISIDSADRDNFKKITGQDLYQKVIAGIHKAIQVSLTPVKLNSVIIKGVNDSPKEILEIAKLSVSLPVTVRFIEYCPTDTFVKPAGDYVSNEIVKGIIDNKLGPLTPVPKSVPDGPAMCFKTKDSAGTIGFISGRTSVFCKSCNRLRLTSDGKLVPCLYSSDNSYDLKALIKKDSGDDELRALIKKALAEKGNYTKLNSNNKHFSMRSIGG